MTLQASEWQARLREAQECFDDEHSGQVESTLMWLDAFATAAAGDDTEEMLGAFLIGNVESGGTDVRAGCLRVLGNLPRAVANQRALLIRFLLDHGESSAVREAAAWALSGRDDLPDVASALRTALSDPERSVAIAVSFAMFDRGVKSEEIVSVMIEAIGIRRYCWEAAERVAAAGTIGASLIGRLQTLCEHWSVDVRTAAAMAWAELGGSCDIVTGVLERGVLSTAVSERRRLRAFEVLAKKSPARAHMVVAALESEARTGIAREARRILENTAEDKSPDRR